MVDSDVDAKEAVRDNNLLKGYAQQPLQLARKWIHRREVGFDGSICVSRYCVLPSMPKNMFANISQGYIGYGVHPPQKFTRVSQESDVERQYCGECSIKNLLRETNVLRRLESKR